MSASPSKSSLCLRVARAPIETVAYVRLVRRRQ